jgi:nitroreductase
VLVVLSRKKAHTYIYDGSLTLGNMMLAAQSIGLGSCWVHRAREVFEKPEWKEWLVSIGVTEEVEGIGNLILGYPAKEAEVKAVCDGRVFYVK